MIMVVICWVLNSYDNLLFPQQPQSSWVDVRHSKELIDIINTFGDINKPNIQISIIQRPMELDKLEENYMQLYLHWQTMNNGINEQILFPHYHSITLKLTLENNRNIFSSKWRATRTLTAQNRTGPIEVIPQAVPSLDMRKCELSYIDCGWF